MGFENLTEKINIEPYSPILTTMVEQEVHERFIAAFVELGYPHEVFRKPLVNAGRYDGLFHLALRNPDIYYIVPYNRKNVILRKVDPDYPVHQYFIFKNDDFHYINACVPDLTSALKQLLKPCDTTVECPLCKTAPGMTCTWVGCNGCENKICSRCAQAQTQCQFCGDDGVIKVQVA